MEQHFRHIVYSRTCTWTHHCTVLNKKFVIAGDVLFQMSIGRTDLPGGDYDTLINSIKTVLLPLAEDTQVFCGHGPSTNIGFGKANIPF